MTNLLEHAVIISRYPHGRCKFQLGAVGLRSDGAIVVSRNGGAPNERTPYAHAEARLCRKLDFGSTVYVARTLKTGAVAMARPCRTCQQLMRSRGVGSVYYTIADDEWGVIQL